MEAEYEVQKIIEKKLKTNRVVHLKFADLQKAY